jgi:tetratricopeptide (TPR) repeat protein
MTFMLRAMVVAALVVSGSSIAHAGDPFAKPNATEARDHLAKGNKLYAVRDFEKAIDEYKAGALVEGAPIFDYNLGQCYRQLGKYDDAIWFYERFINRGQPTGDVLSAVNDFISQMKAEREKKAMTQPPIEAAPNGKGSASSEVAAPTTLPVVSASPKTEPAAPGDSSSSQGKDWLGIGLVAVGGVGVVVGGGLLWDAHSINDDANNTADQKSRDALHSKADTRSLTGTIVGVAGVAVLATGVIKLVVGHHHATPTTARWDVGASSDSVFVFGRF